MNWLIKNIILLLLAVSYLFAQDSTPPLTPTGIKSISYEQHIDLIWQPNSEVDLAGYKIYRFNGNSIEFVRTVKKYRSFYWDWLGTLNVERKYKISAYDLSGNESPLSDEITVKTKSMSDDEFLDMTQRAVFRYFWDWGDSNSGLARERWQPNELDVTNTIGGGGFGVMAIIVGVERGFVTREDGAKRILKILNFLTSTADRFHGVFPHWLNGTTGKVVNFGIQNGGDIVETSFMIQGLLTARQYFYKLNEDEGNIRKLSDDIWRAVDWEFYRNGSTGLYWNWSPTMGFNFSDTFIFHGWNETLITYLLAIASPTKPVILPALSFYRSGWGNGDQIRNTSIYYNIPLYVGSNYGGPLFWTHYSFLGFDPRGKKDWYTNYFNHNKNQTLVNRAYCINNPKKFEGYNENSWGLTASNSIPGVNYLAHEPGSNDNGTIAPTAAISSMPYTPNESIAALKYFYRTYGAQLWGDFGFKDAFNISKQWFNDDYLAIDQGPIICMIENYRTQLLWNNFMSSPEIQPLLDFSSGKGLFFPDQTNFREEEFPTEFKLFDSYPNPFNPSTTIKFSIPEESKVSLEVFNILGQSLSMLYNDIKNVGSYVINWNAGRFTSGVYIIRMKAIAVNSNRSFMKKIKVVLVK